MTGPFSFKEQRRLLGMAASSMSLDEAVKRTGRPPESIRKIALKLGISFKTQPEFHPPRPVASRPGGKGKMKRESETLSFAVGDRIRIVPTSLAWKAEMKLRRKIGEVIERREDGRISVRFDGGKLLMGRDAGAFEHAGEIGLRAPK